MAAPIDSDQASIDLAKTAAATYSNALTVSCRLHEEQGNFSKTYVVKLEDQSKVIVQFRATLLDLSLYEFARRTSFWPVYALVP